MAGLGTWMIPPTLRHPYRPPWPSPPPSAFARLARRSGLSEVGQDLPEDGLGLGAEHQEATAEDVRRDGADAERGRLAAVGIEHVRVAGRWLVPPDSDVRPEEDAGVVMSVALTMATLPGDPILRPKSAAISGPS